MNLFKCQHCGFVLFFENRNCGSCGRALGFSPADQQLLALDGAGDDQWISPNGGGHYRFCTNAGRDACNWLLPADSPEKFCVACRHNRTVPDLSNDNNVRDWRKMEFAKHRLFYTLLKLNLPLANRIDNPESGLAFDFLADPTDGSKVMTGHDNGIITLALKEADDAEREKRRNSLHEPYRTLLGHFRHEIGHYYWDRLVADGNHLDECRALFGDDRQDYGEALKRHYDQGAPANWQEHFVTSYATSHPWEDFAESWAHYLHIMDCLETSHNYGMRTNPSITSDPNFHADTVPDPYHEPSFDKLIGAWLPLTFAMNAMNRSMGLGDLYPFVLSSDAIKKLAFIHTLVMRRSA